MILEPDKDLANADWTKQSWDLPVSSAKALRAYLKERGISIKAFKSLPVYRANVGKLKWLKDL